MCKAQTEACEFYSDAFGTCGTCGAKGRVSLWFIRETRERCAKKKVRKDLRFPSFAYFLLIGRQARPSRTSSRFSTETLPSKDQLK